MIRKRFLVVAAVLYMFCPQLMLGCAVCFGDPGSPMAHGINAAIITLLGVTGTVLGGIVAFTLQLRKRAKRMKRHEGNGQALHRNEMEGGWF